MTLPRWVGRWALPVLAALVTLNVVPRLGFGADAEAWLDHDLARDRAHGVGLVRHLERQVSPVVLQTGDQRLDGQASVAYYQMTLLALGQLTLAHPERRGEWLPAMRVAAERLADPRTLRYAAQRYRHHAAQGMGPGEGHAYAGYIALGLGMLCAVEREHALCALHDRMTRALGARLFASRTGLIETYPGETWPPDVAAAAGAVGLHLKITGEDRRAEVAAWSARFAACAVDPVSGYLVQRVRTGSCAPVDAPRGSGTALGAYFLSFIDPEFARRLATALREGRVAMLGFGGLREYPAGHAGPGDLNAGPIVLGVSVGATGFGLGAAAVTGDRALFQELLRTADLFGAPTVRGDGAAFVTGGALGNALLLAMLTAAPP